MITVFVLEDDPDLLDLYTRALTFRGHDVTFTNSAESAIRMLREGTCSPDVAVLDMSMPGLPGSAVVDFIRNYSLNPELPIIVISCDEEFRTQLQSFDVRFMTKPISLSDLYQAVAEVTAQPTTKVTAQPTAKVTAKVATQVAAWVTA